MEVIYKEISTKLATYIYGRLDILGNYWSAKACPIILLHVQNVIANNFPFMPILFSGVVSAEHLSWHEKLFQRRLRTKQRYIFWKECVKPPYGQQSYLWFGPVCLRFWSTYPDTAWSTPNHPRQDETPDETSKRRRPPGSTLLSSPPPLLFMSEVYFPSPVSLYTTVIGIISTSYNISSRSQWSQRTVMMYMTAKTMKNTIQTAIRGKDERLTYFGRLHCSKQRCWIPTFIAVEITIRGVLTGLNLRAACLHAHNNPGPYKGRHQAIRDCAQPSKITWRKESFAKKRVIIKSVIKLAAYTAIVFQRAISMSTSSPPRFGTRGTLDASHLQ